MSRTQSMTDEEIVAGYLAHKLWLMIPDTCDIHAIAGYRLHPARAERIAGLIVERLEAMRRPLLRTLNGHAPE